MFKVVLAVACLVLSAASLRAGGLDDLKAATMAVEVGNGAEAIRLFTQALTAGDLPAADQAAARKGRGNEYIVKSMIADNFDRGDEARGLRENAVADFTAALALKPGDASFNVARGQAYHFNRQYDLAIADFDAALKLDNSTATLVQRAASLRAKGDYDRAAADYTAALALGGKEAGKAGGLEGWEIYNERGYTQFLAARYDNAAADFDRALTIGLGSHDGDVLWLPYQAAWLHIARARAGQNDAEELTRNAGKVDLKQWPGTLVAYFLGQATLDQISPPSNHGAMGHGRECNLSFFTGEQALIKKDSAEASRLFARAHDICNAHTVIALASTVESKRLEK
jgi:tetratricopeptide (TPR) repeat protein